MPLSEEDFKKLVEKAAQPVVTAAEKPAHGDGSASKKTRRGKAKRAARK